MVCVISSQVGGSATQLRASLHHCELDDDIVHTLVLLRLIVLFQWHCSWT